MSTARSCSLSVAMTCGLEFVAVGEDALDVGGLIDDVLVGDDVAGGVDDEAGAQGLRRHLADLAAEEAVEDFIAGAHAAP